MKMMMKILQIERQFIAKKWTQLVTKLPLKIQEDGGDLFTVFENILKFWRVLCIQCILKFWRVLCIQLMYLLKLLNNIRFQV